jgi:dihydropteroate synthase
MIPFTIKNGNQTLSVDKPIVMGILNITPDSFYDGAKHQIDYLSHTERMLLEGATIIDIGAMSSRPGAEIIDPTTEWSRLFPVIKALKQSFPTAIFSVDTIHAEVAKQSLENGIEMINDISAGEIDEKMLEVMAHYKAPYIAMHMKGIPMNMQFKNQYTNLIQELLMYFENKIEHLHQMGIDNIIIDPGFGFAKNIAQNFELLQYLDAFQKFQSPIMVGLSRKSMIWKSLHSNAEDALNGTTVLNTIAILKGAQILRVHDVKEAMEVIQLCARLPKQ